MVRHRWTAGATAGPLRARRRWLRVSVRPVVAAPARSGIAVLTNSADHPLQGDLALSILRDLTHRARQRLSGTAAPLPAQAAADEPDGGYRPPTNLRDLIAEAAIPRSGDEAQRWADYCRRVPSPRLGRHQSHATGGAFPDRRRRSLRGGGSRQGTAVRHRLTEIERGLFIADDGETLDFRGVMPTWRNSAGRATGGPTVRQSAILAFVGFLAGASRLVTAAVSALQRRRRRDGPGVNREPAGRRQWRRLALSAVAALHGDPDRACNDRPDRRHAGLRGLRIPRLA